MKVVDDVDALALGALGWLYDPRIVNVAFLDLSY